jgi:hypothetical protein
LALTRMSERYTVVAVTGITGNTDQTLGDAYQFGNFILIDPEKHLDCILMEALGDSTLSCDEMEKRNVHDR